MALPLNLAAESMSGLVALMVAGQVEALGEILRRHLPRMRAIAVRSLRRHPEVRPRFDEDDAVQCTLLKLMGRVGKGRFGSVDGENGFWRLFRRLLAQRVATEGGFHGARKRGGSGASAKARTEPATGAAARLAAHEALSDELDWQASNAPSVESCAISAETFAALLRLLDRESARIAALWLEGCTLPAIAEQLGMHLRTVERRVHEIRTIWKDSGPLDQPE